MSVSGRVSQERNRGSLFQLCMKNVPHKKTKALEQDSLTVRNHFVFRLSTGPKSLYLTAIVLGDTANKGRHAQQLDSAIFRRAQTADFRGLQFPSSHARILSSRHYAEAERTAHISWRFLSAITALDRL